jgi:hypothetical protein
VVSHFLRYFSSTSTEQISSDSAGPFTSFDTVGFAIATTGTGLRFRPLRLNIRHDAQVVCGSQRSPHNPDL